MRILVELGEKNSKGVSNLPPMIEIMGFRFDKEKRDYEINIVVVYGSISWMPECFKDDERRTATE
jgi:hypothetical protein